MTSLFHFLTNKMLADLGTKYQHELTDTDVLLVRPGMTWDDTRHFGYDHTSDNDGNLLNNGDYRGFSFTDEVLWKEGVHEMIKEIGFREFAKNIIVSEALIGAFEREKMGDCHSVIGSELFHIHMNINQRVEIGVGVGRRGMIEDQEVFDRWKKVVAGWNPPEEVDAILDQTAVRLWHVYRCGSLQDNPFFKPSAVVKFRGSDDNIPLRAGWWK